MTTEIWKDITGYEGFYQVSDLGRVKSLERVDSLGRKVKEKIKNTSLNKNGYLQVSLYRNRVRKCCYIHRLVAESFISNPNNFPQINHINANKKDNSAINLEWVSPSKNMQHAYENGLLKNPSRKGENNTNVKLTEKQAIEIYRRVKNGEKYKVLCEEFGVKKDVISKIKRGKTWNYLNKDLLADI
jgi:hypothetical protein